MYRLLVGSLLLAWSFALTVRADDSTDPAHVQRFEVYKELAEQGDAKAQLLLGNHYFLGKGTPVDKKSAMLWVRKSAEAGLADAQEFLAMALMEGEQGVDKNLAEAQTWFHKAAEQGKTRAQRLLAAMLLSGIGGEKNTEAAREWLGKAAAQNDADAMYSLATSLFDGRFGEPDYVTARHWFQKVFSEKNEAADYLGQIHERGMGVPVDRTQAAWWYFNNHRINDLTSTLRLSMLLASQPDWTLLSSERMHLSPLLAEPDDAVMLAALRQQASAGEPTALLSLGVLQQLGARGVTADRKAAFQSFKAAADQGLPDARYLVARKYSVGDGVDSNRGAAQQALQELSEAGHAPSQAYLGHLLRFDVFGAANPGEAIRLLELAAKNGASSASNLLAYLYGEGKDVGKDQQKAFAHKLAAARAGSHFAQRQLAMSYYIGLGVEKDLAAARAWLTVSNRFLGVDEKMEKWINDDLRDKDRKKASRLLGEWQVQLPMPLTVIEAPASKK